MAAPTLINTVQIGSPWAQVSNIASAVSTKNYAATLTTTAGDLILVLQGSVDADANGELTTTDGTNTYNQRTSIQTTLHCTLNIATTTDAAGGTRTITLNRAATDIASIVGGVALQFRSHGGVGNVFTAANGVQTGGLSCSANSAIAVICVDWGATSGAHSWATINGNAPTGTYGVTGDSINWAAAVAYWADVGAAGTKTITLSSPNFTTESFAAIEILAGSVSSSNGAAAYYYANH